MWLAGRQADEQEDVAQSVAGREKTMLLGVYQVISTQHRSYGTNKVAEALNWRLETGKPGLKYCGADEGMSCRCVNFTGGMEYVA